MLKKLALAGALCCALIATALAQSSPGLYTGQVPSAANWNSYFASKQDVLGAPSASVRGAPFAQPGYVDATGLGSAANYPASSFTNYTPPGTRAQTQSIAYRSGQHVLATDYASGSGAGTWGSVSAGSSIFTLNSAIDFVNGQGVVVFGAGPAPTVGAPSSINTVQNGTVGTTTYTYQIASADYAGGIGTPVTTSISNGNSSLTSANSVTITLTPGTGSGEWLIWKSTNGGAYVYVGAGAGSTWVDTGYVMGWRPFWVPATPPSSAQADWLVTTITSGAQSSPGAGDGSTTLHLAANASTTVSGQYITHDDTAALNSFNTNFPNGVTVDFPCGNYNITSQVSVTNAYITFNGSGLCSEIQTFGNSNAIYFSGPSNTSFILGNGFNNFYMSGFNSIGGIPVYGQYLAAFTFNNVYMDHPWLGPEFYDVNDLRSEHVRVIDQWEYGSWAIRIASGSTSSDYTCCVMLVDFYSNALGTISGGNGMRNGGTGIYITGNADTIIGYNSAVSNIEGTGMYIANDVGNPSGPEFIQWKDFGSEFSAGIGLNVVAGHEVYFSDSVIHGARNGNNNVVVGSAADNVSFQGGRVGNAGGNCFDLAGEHTRIVNMSIFNCAAPNSGGVSGASHGIVLEPTSSSTVISGNTIGKSYSVGWQMAHPVFVVAGAQMFAITGNVFEGSVYDWEQNNAGYSATQVVSGNSGRPPVTLAGGWGTSPSITMQNGPDAFRVNVGTGGTIGQGAVTLPLAVSGWNCKVNDMTTTSSSVFMTKQIAGTTTTATFQNYNSSGSVAAWSAGDTLQVECIPQ